MGIRFLSFFVICVFLFTGCSEQNRQWKEAVKTNTVAAFEQYIKAFPDGSRLDEARQRIETLEWNDASTSKNKDKLESFIKRYPKNANIEKAREELWAIKWPPVTISKANSVTIWSKGEKAVYGSKQQGFVAFVVVSGGRMVRVGDGKPVGSGPNKVIIYRDFSMEQLDYASKKDLRTGVAYLETKPEVMSVIKKVDLSKNDAQLCTDFGIEVKQ